MSLVRQRWSLLTAIAALVLLTATGLTPRHVSAAQANQRSLTVGILDKANAPVTELTANDVIVREDGVAREIVRVAPAPPPTEVVILVDDSQAATSNIRDLREALTNFADRLADMDPAPAVRLVTIGDRPTTLVDFNPVFSAVSRGIDRIAARPGSGATLLEAVDESARALERRRAERPVIVAFVNEAGPEFGTLRHTNIATALERAKASLWTIVLTSRAGGGSSDAERERDLVIGDVTRQSGGHNQPILASQHIPGAFERLATQLASRWEITYGRPDRLIPPSKLEIQTRDSSRQVLAPRWAGR
jgi:hypothetical protein